MNRRFESCSKPAWAGFEVRRLDSDPGRFELGVLVESVQ